MVLEPAKQPVGISVAIRFSDSFSPEQKHFSESVTTRPETNKFSQSKEKALDDNGPSDFCLLCNDH